VATSATQYGRYLQRLTAGRLQMAQLLQADAVCTNPATCAGAVYSPVGGLYSWHYAWGHWIEDDPATGGDGAFSSAGAFGFYPWLDAGRTWWGIVARRTEDELGAGQDQRPARESAACGARIRAAPCPTPSSSPSMATPLRTAARPGQPPRPDHRRHRHRQDHHAAEAGRELQRIGVPVFMADVKGDLTGITQAGSISPKLAGILKERGLPTPDSVACPATLWDVFGEQGHPVRATVSDMGPLLLARMLALNETQAGVLNLVFKIADDNGLLLLDMKDLRAMLQFVGDNSSQFTTEYGNISAASVGAIQRGLLQIESRAATASSASPCSTSATSCRPWTARAWSTSWPPTS
jgi:hypothetical protein